MFSVPFALSIHKFINSIGADVGFASIVAVALLVLLYFAHAREAASLRERLDEAQARIGGLEARLLQLLNAQAAQRARGPVPAGAPTVPGAPQPQPAAGAIPAVRRMPTATAAGALVATGAAGNGVAPLAPLGVGAPALASATKVIPTLTPAAGPSPAPVGVAQAPDATMFVAPGTNGHAATEVAGDTRMLPPVAPASPPPPRSVQAPGPAPTPAGSSPPPVRIGADGPDRSRRRPAPSSLLLEDEYGREPSRLRSSGRLLPLLISGLAVVVIVVGLILITSSGSGSPTTAVVKHTNTTPTGASVTNQPKSKPAPFDAAKVQVAVLNGTAVAGLASDVSNALKKDGYQPGNVTNAAVQTQATTVVYYATGAHAAADRVAAQHVAGALSLAASSVQPASAAVLQSCATGPTGNALGSCGAEVIVSVGSDRASLASNTAG